MQQKCITQQGVARRRNLCIRKRRVPGRDGDPYHQPAIAVISRRSP
jgi:hypothetical protein